MTIAGTNLRFDVWRVNYGNDDEVGGAVITGTCVYPDVMGRAQVEEPSQLLLQQGLETPLIITLTVVPGTLDIRERDMIYFSEPHDYIYYHQYFRVVGSRPSSFMPRDPRNYMILTVTRSKNAHANTLNQ